jgi:hypothetical protein
MTLFCGYVRCSSGAKWIEELREELDFHIEMQTRKSRRHEPEVVEAERQARLKFGSVVRATEECRDQRGIAVCRIGGSAAIRSSLGRINRIVAH